MTRDETVEPNSRDQTLRRERGQGKFDFPCSADHEQDWQSYAVGAQSAESDDHTHTHSMSEPGCVVMCNLIETHTHRKMSMSGPGCAVICNLINTHTHCRAVRERVERAFPLCRVLSKDAVTVVAITDPP